MQGNLLIQYTYPNTRFMKNYAIISVKAKKDLKALNTYSVLKITSNKIETKYFL